MNATETRYDNLYKLTVPVLKEMAARMNVPLPYRAKKADIVNAMMVQIDLDHTKALEDEAFRNENVKAFKSLTVKARMNNYKAQTGGYLTKRQQRRIAKKYAQALKRGFDLEAVTGFVL